MNAVEASHILRDVEADQAAARIAAAPPKRTLVLMAIGWGCIYVLPAIPDQTGHLRLLLFLILVLIDLGLSLRWQRRRRVQLGRGGTFLPLRSASIVPVLMIIAFLVFVAASLTPVAHNLLPWWFYVSLGVTMGCLTHAGLRWIWRDWARTVSA